MKLPIFLITVFLCSVLSAQRPDKKLEKKIKETIRGFNGDVGVYVKNLRTGKTVAINADTVFPTASIVKIPILIGIMNKVQKRNWTLTKISCIRIHCSMPGWTSWALLRMMRRSS